MCHGEQQEEQLVVVMRRGSRCTALGVILDAVPLGLTCDCDESWLMTAEQFRERYNRGKWDYPRYGEEITFEIPVV